MIRGDQTIVWFCHVNSHKNVENFWLKWVFCFSIMESKIFPISPKISKGKCFFAMLILIRICENFSFDMGEIMFAWGLLCFVSNTTTNVCIRIQFTTCAAGFFFVFIALYVFPLYFSQIGFLHVSNVSLFLCIYISWSIHQYDYFGAQFENAKRNVYSEFTISSAFWWIQMFV